MRVYIKISYDGSKFLGFQKQKSSEFTIATYIQQALQKLGINENIVASGRTDKNVHANNQALHLDLPPFWNDLNSLHVMLNRHLHPFVHVKKIYKVKNHFHARFSARAREYRYVFSHDEFNPFNSSFCVFYPKFDIKKLNEILCIFKGEHNFEFFKKNGSETKNYIREIYQIKALSYKNKTIITIKANGFLRSQIRMIISCILKIYENKLTCNKAKEQLTLTHIHTQTLSPPNGLYLHRIFYDRDIFV